MKLYAKRLGMFAVLNNISQIMVTSSPFNMIPILNVNWIIRLNSGNYS